MAHTVEFDSSFLQILGIISREEIVDLIDLFFKHDNARFFVTCSQALFEKGLRGSHRYVKNQRLHSIFLSPQEIRRTFNIPGVPMGGNVPALSLKMAAAMVFVHELQHANQTVDRLTSIGLPDRRIPFQRYLDRPIEKDARAFVDRNFDQIAAFCGVEVDRDYITKNKVEPSTAEIEEELYAIADVLGENSTVHVKDIVEELRSSGLNNSKNVLFVSSILVEGGSEVSYGAQE